MVHLFCAERDVDPYRSTPDVDTVLDVGSVPTILMDVTTALEDAGFKAKGQTMGGRQHRWEDGLAKIDVLIPDNLGRSADHRGAGGSPGLSTPGAQFALNRAESLTVRVGAVEGAIRRPSLVGTCIIKAAAYSVTVDSGRDRHLDDLALRASMLTRADLAAATLVKGERKYLAPAIAAAHEHPRTSEIEGGESGLDRLSIVLRQ